MQCTKYNKSEKWSDPNSNCVIVFGFKDFEYKGEKRDRVEGIVTCNKQDIDKKKGFMDLIDIFESENKAELHEAFARFSKKYWGWIRPTHTVDELEEKGLSFLEEVLKLPNIASAKIVGSLKSKNTHPYSDVDIKLRRISCPGKRNCLVNKLLAAGNFNFVDIYCYPEKKK
tara:strand:+ start:21423 stop:21935 length:513 start_codon:yes stop_codon:yes gene_type:complete